MSIHPYDVNAPTLCFDDDRFDWKMSRWEKYALSSLLAVRKPKLAIEVGTFSGGSLQLLAAHARMVYSIDSNPTCSRMLGPLYKNVEFVVGDSRLVLPELLAKLYSEKQEVGFLLVDGDHSAEGVAADIRAILRFPPLCEFIIAIHDSFNPECREGVLAVDWQSCPYVHYVEVDFVPGAFHCHAFDSTEARSMWGGFAVARLQPDPRNVELLVNESQRASFDIIRAQSRHAVTTQQ